MAIESLCKKRVVTVGKKSTLRELAQLMKKEHVGSVVVTEDFEGKERPIGIITDRDIALAMADANEPRNVRVEHIMQSQPILMNVGDGIFDTVMRMREFGVRRLPVVKADGTLFGIVSVEDLLRLISEEINGLSKISDIQMQREQGARLPAERYVHH